MSKASKIPFAETDYGFEYGSAKVERLHSDEKTGAVWISVTTPKHFNPMLQIYITKTGKIRVYLNGEWTVPS